MKRVLLDENLPKQLARELGSGHTGIVHDQGWAGISNGELLKRAAVSFDVLISTDQNLLYQQTLENAPIGAMIGYAKVVARAC